MELIPTPEDRIRMEQENQCPLCGKFSANSEEHVECTNYEAMLADIPEVILEANRESYLIKKYNEKNI